MKVLITSANVIEPLLVQECGAGHNVLTPISPQRDEKGGMRSAPVLIYLLVRHGHVHFLKKTVKETYLMCGAHAEK